MSLRALLARGAWGRLQSWWKDRQTPDSIHDGEPIETFVDELEEAGADVVDPHPEEMRIALTYPGRWTHDLETRVSDHYRLLNEKPMADSDTRIMLLVT